MTGKWTRAAVFAALGVGLVALTAGTGVTAAQKDDKDLPDISAIMKKAHAKTDGYLARIGGAAKDGKWDDAQKYAKDLVLAGEALGKNTPPKGAKASWEKLTSAYVTNAKAVADATEKKDAKATQTALGAITKSCGGCHSVHKGK
jgi:cytochrome c556